MRRAALSLCAAFSLLLGAALGASVVERRISELTTSATDVAVVEVLRRIPVEFEFEGGVSTCGYRVEARVIESFKGEPRWLQFLDPLEGDASESKERYLIFALAQTNKVDETREASSFDDARSRCMVGASSRVVTAQPRRLLRLSDTKAASGGWVHLPAGTAIDVSMLRRKPDPPSDAEVLVSWPDVYREIQQTVDAMEQPR